MLTQILKQFYLNYVMLFYPSFNAVEAFKTFQECYTEDEIQTECPFYQPKLQRFGNLMGIRLFQFSEEGVWLLKSEIGKVYLGVIYDKRIAWVDFTHDFSTCEILFNLN